MFIKIMQKSSVNCVPVFKLANFQFPEYVHVVQLYLLYFTVKTFRSIFSLIPVLTWLFNRMRPKKKTCLKT